MELIEKINELKESEVGDIVRERIEGFGEVDDLFGELCFCLMTAGRMGIMVY